MNTGTIIVLIVFGVLFLGVIAFMFSVSFRLKKLREKLDGEKRENDK